MEKLIVSMMRFSSAVALFGVEQMQGAMKDTDVQKAMDRLCTALDSFSAKVTDEVDDSKKEVLDSIAKVSEDAVHRTFDGMNLGMMDPNEAVRTTVEVMKKTTDSVADWMAKSDAEKNSDTPEPAAVALSGSKARAGKSAK